MTGGDRLLRILAAVVFVAVVAASMVVAWLRVEHPRPDTADGHDQAHAAAVVEVRSADALRIGAPSAAHRDH